MPLQIIHSLCRVRDIEVNTVLASESSGNRLPNSEEELIKHMWMQAIILLSRVYYVSEEYIYCYKMPFFREEGC